MITIIQWASYFFLIVLIAYLAFKYFQLKRLRSKKKYYSWGRSFENLVQSKIFEYGKMRRGGRFSQKKGPLKNARKISQERRKNERDETLLLYEEKIEKLSSAEFSEKKIMHYQKKYHGALLFLRSVHLGEHKAMGTLAAFFKDKTHIHLNTHRILAIARELFEARQFVENAEKLDLLLLSEIEQLILNVSYMKILLRDLETGHSTLAKEIWRHSEHNEKFFFTTLLYIISLALGGVKKNLLQDILRHPKKLKQKFNGVSDQKRLKIILEFLRKNCDGINRLEDFCPFFQRQMDELNQFMKRERERTGEHKRPKNIFSDSYTLLGCGPQDSLKIVKKCYKAKVLMYHPDRYIGVELSEDKKKALEQKFLEIQKAYEQIVKSKKSAA